MVSSEIGIPGGKLSTMQPTLGQWLRELAASAILDVQMNVYLSPNVVTRRNFPKVDMVDDLSSASATRKRVIRRSRLRIPTTKSCSYLSR
jgi:hypothetical protein